MIYNNNNLETRGIKAITISMIGQHDWAVNEKVSVMTISIIGQSFFNLMTGERFLRNDFKLQQAFILVIKR